MWCFKPLVLPNLTQTTIEDDLWPFKCVLKKCQGNTFQGHNTWHEICIKILYVNIKIPDKFALKCAPCVWFARTSYGYPEKQCNICQKFVDGIPYFKVWRLLTSTTMFRPSMARLVIMMRSSGGIWACWMSFVKFSSEIPTSIAMMISHLKSGRRIDSGLLTVLWLDIEEDHSHFVFNSDVLVE